MANELTSALKSVAAKIADYVDKAATLTVETGYLEIGDTTTSFETARPVASTVIKLDGDSKTIIPMQRSEAGVLQADGTLYELHQRNVATAIDYRARMMDAMLQSLREVVNR